MNCPKCGKGNPDDNKTCNFCNSPLIQSSPPDGEIVVKISTRAVASFVCAIAGIAALVLTVALGSPVPAVVFAVLAACAVLFGIIGLVEIDVSGGRRTGMAFAIIGIVIPSLIVLFLFAEAALYRPRSVAFRMVCGTNLSGIGKAMMIYANDYADELPKAGGHSTRWTGHTPAWDGLDHLPQRELGLEGMARDGLDECK